MMQVQLKYFQSVDSFPFEKGTFKNSSSKSVISRIGKVQILDLSSTMLLVNTVRYGSGRTTTFLSSIFSLS